MKNSMDGKFVRMLVSAFCLLTLAGLNGCAGKYQGFPVVTERYDTVVHETPPAGFSVKGIKISKHVFGQGSESILIIGGIHGDEPASKTLALRFAQYLASNGAICAGRKIVVIPEANPDGMLLGERTNARGIDINRNFPAVNRQNNQLNGFEALSEPESAALYEVINELKPVRILSIHQPYGIIDYDGPGEQIADKMALSCSLPVKKLGARPGSLGSYAGEELKIPIITMELGQLDHELSPQRLWEIYGKAAIAFVEGVKVLEDLKTINKL